MNTIRKITDNELNAYVDHELDARTRLEVEAWLAEHPEDALRVSEFRRQKEELHSLFDPILEEPIPEAMSDVILHSRNRAVRFTWLQVAAAFALLVLSAAGGWGLRSLQVREAPDQAIAFADRAAGAHDVYGMEVRHPVEVNVEQEAHLVAWLSKRLGHPLRAPNLNKAGYNLLGGRLLPDVGVAAAQFMYENADKRRITIYVKPDQGRNTAFRFIDQGGTLTFYWIDSPFAYALSGQLPRKELLEVALLVYNALTP